MLILRGIFKGDFRILRGDYKWGILNGDSNWGF